MRELYSWFLNAARMGWKFLDALVRGTARWASYPAHILYNAGISAYSSFYTAQYMSQNTGIPLDRIISMSSGNVPQIGSLPTIGEFIDYFPSYVDPPYTGQGLIITGSPTTGTFNTVNIPMSISDNFMNLYAAMDRLAKQLKYLEDAGYLDIRLTFVIGNPRLVGERP